MTHDADLIVIGAGPAGVAAALMAASLGQRTLVIDPGPVGGKLHRIGALANAPGAWTSGPELAAALEADLNRLQQAGTCRRVTGRAVAVNGHDAHAEVCLADGRSLTAAAVVVATGVHDQEPADTDWLTVPDRFTAAPLWRARPEQLHGVTYVLGADRPLGTWLRAHPDTRRTLHVLVPPGDDYKTGELADDERVRLVPVLEAAMAPARGADGSLSIRTVLRDGQVTEYVVQTVLANLGNQPAALKGLVRGADGYYPPAEQHPRILTAGDLRSAKFQRIVTAQGSGADAALTVYYGATIPAEPATT